MPIVKRDRNSQLRKNEGTNLRKMNPHESMTQELKNNPQSRAPLRWREVVRIPWPVDTIGLSAGYHATPSQKNRQGKRERPRTGCQGPARGQNMMMMMTN